MSKASAATAALPHSVRARPPAGRLERGTGSGRVVRQGSDLVAPDPEQPRHRSRRSLRVVPEDRARQHRTVHAQRQRASSLPVAQHGMRPPARPVPEVEAEEAIRGRGVGDEPNGGIGRGAADSLGTDRSLQDIGLVAQHQIERGVGIAGEPPDGSTETGRLASRRVGREDEELPPLPSLQPGKDRSRRGARYWCRLPTNRPACPPTHASGSRGRGRSRRTAAPVRARRSAR